MNFAIAIALLFAFQSTPDAAATGGNAADEARQTAASAEQAEDITDRNHPKYVRCKSQAVIGSRAKRQRTCMTNEEWAQVARQGNERSREMVQDSTAGFIPQ